MKRKASRFLSLLLSLAMVFSLSGLAYAADDTDSSAGSSEENLIVTFEVGEGASVDLYYDKDTYEEDASAEPDETNVTSAYVRAKGDSAIDNSGDGQVNFRVNLEDGYELESVTAEPEDNYNNLKGSEETGVEGIYRVTKITGDVTVTITTSKTETDAEDTESSDAEESTAAAEINSKTLWTYWDGETDPAGDSTDADYSRTSWTLADYDDSSWSTGYCSFGAKNGELTSLSGGYTPTTLLTQYYEGTDTNIPAFFFRAEVYVEDASEVAEILGSVLYDDSATVYINGTRIAGFDDDDITSNTEYGGSNDGAPNTGLIDVTDADTIAAVLVDGVNQIAVEVHNGRASSSDVYFDMTSLTFETETTEDSEEEEDSEDSTAAEINSETLWSYWDEETDPAGDSTDADYSRTSWTQADYDVSSWKTGYAAFGAKYGELTSLSGGYTPTTLLTQYYDGTETDIPAYFFRTTVEIEDSSAIKQIAGEVIYDDSATVYINGTRIAGYDDDDITSNTEYGGSNSSAPKTGTILITDEETLQSVLVDGENIVAVEVHNGRSSSSDIYFDMTSLVFSTEEYSDDSEPDQTSISLAVGADETERGITWYFNGSGEGTLYLAKESDLVDGAMPSDAAVYTTEGVLTENNKTGYYSYQLTMTDLEEDTVYAYQVVNGETVSEIYTFETGTTDGSFSFALAGDPQIGAGTLTTDIEGWENTLDIVDSNSIFDDIDFLLSAGDQVNTSNDEDEYDGFLEHDALFSLPIATVIGNHDTSSSAYSEHFNIVNESSTYGTTSAGSDYYFVYEGVLFMVLNSNNTSTAEHQAFMEEAIAATADQDISWKVVTFHHSIYSVASHSLEDSIIQRRNELVPVFEDLDIDVVLMGHDHVYVRTYMMDGLEISEDENYEYDDEDTDLPISVTDTDGILYVTVNSASGSKYYNIKTDQNFEYAAVMNQDYTPNISLVEITEESFTVTTYETSSMSEVDTFSIYRSHEYDDGVVTTEATCTEDGVMTYTCTVCGDTYTEAISATGHSYDDGVATEATCTEGGYTTYTCTVCGDSYTADETEAAGHSYDTENPSWSWTKSEDGYTAAVSFTCTVCNEVQTVTAEVTSETADDGTVTYTATADFDSATYTDTMTDESATEENEDADAQDSESGEDAEGSDTEDGNAEDSGTGDEENIEYNIIDGADQTIARGEDLTVTADGDLEKFTGLLVNGEELDAEAYMAESGSTIATVSSEYLDTLDLGTYTLTFSYEDGSAETTFTLAEAEAEEDNSAAAGTADGDSSETGSEEAVSDEDSSDSSSDEAEASDASASDETSSNAETGDSTSLVFWIILFAMAFATAASAGVRRKLN